MLAVVLACTDAALGRPWSPTSASPRASARASTSRAASTTASASAVLHRDRDREAEAGRWEPRPRTGPRGDRPRHCRRHRRPAPAGSCCALRPPRRSSALAPDPRRPPRPGGRHRDRARREHLHRGVRRRPRVRRAAAIVNGEVRELVDEGGELFNAVTFIVFGAAILGPLARRAHLAGPPLRGAQPDRRPNAAVALACSAPAPGETVAFVGWFGPRGLASIVFAVLLVEETELPHLRTLVLAVAVTRPLGLRPRANGRPLPTATHWWLAHPPRGPAGDGERPRRRAPHRVATV